MPTASKKILEEDIGLLGTRVTSHFELTDVGVKQTKVLYKSGTKPSPECQHFLNILWLKVNEKKKNIFKTNHMILTSVTSFTWDRSSPQNR